jgi:hypothetical protein
MNARLARVLRYFARGSALSYFAWSAAAARGMAPASSLVDCPSCRRDCVAPVAIAEAGPSHWEVRLRCGECGEARDVRITDAEAEDYDEALDRHTEVMRRELAELERERMAADVDAFIRALSLDLIEASDFAR